MPRDILSVLLTGVDTDPADGGEDDDDADDDVVEERTDVSDADRDDRSDGDADGPADDGTDESQPARGEVDAGESDTDEGGDADADSAPDGADDAVDSATPEPTGDHTSMSDAEYTTDESEEETSVDGDRLERAMAAVGFGSDDARLLENDGADGDAELGFRAVDVEEAYGMGPGNEILSKHARNVSKVTARPVDTDRASRVASVARQQAAKDVPPSAFVGTYAKALERLTDDAFEELAEGADPEAVRDRLVAALKATMVDVQVGVDEFADADVAPLAEDEYIPELTFEEVFDAIPYPVFLIDDEHTLLEYNEGLSIMLGLDADHREFLGGDNRETIAAATYTDGSRHNSLVDKVAMNPRDAEEHWDVERVDPDNEYTEHIVYQDTSVSTNTEGEETHIAFLAVPFFDDDGDLKGVFEFVEDRSDEVLHQQGVTDLVNEVTDTLHAIGDGNLSARAEFEDEHDVIENELLELTTDVNQMADNFQDLIRDVDEKTGELAESIDRATTSAHNINQKVNEQNTSLEQVANEMEDFSATMEEVAASSSEVASAAERALEEADDGVESGQDARDVTVEVMEISDRLVDTVEQLDEYMNEIGEVVEVISEVADQTNMLALNANIEAARAGEAGSGFAVVADEVKNLANETQEHTEEIADRIEMIQDQASETVDEVEESHDRIQDAETEIQNALDSLETISDKVGAAADGIHEVADANDEQAATVEEVMATVDDVRDDAKEVSSMTEDIVHEAERQESHVFELSDQVTKLSSNTGDGEPHEQ